ncbi:MAG: DUF3800 domain-containing protein [Sulfurimonas sp.]|uniref:DUF3800 domain-containing protein n=1 Tax=Sulfurimonas sp. TaxID=2022749 RepID=UPI003D11F48D
MNTFYYDESNNHRKFYLKDKSFNIQNSDLNFVLAGVLKVTENSDFNYDEFKQEINLQNNAKEIKFKHIAKGDFLKCLDSNKLTLFFEYLYKSNLYVHYSNINIFYWGTVDIIDSLVYNGFDYSLVPHLKNKLYKIILKDKASFAQLLHTYEYPNIKKEEINSFIDKVLTFMQQHKSKENNQAFCFELEKLLYGAFGKKELVFIQDEEQHILIDSFFPFYVRSLEVFKNDKHVFDHEPTIEESFEKNKVYITKQQINNYEFIDSTQSELIQVSDITAGFLGKYFSFLNSLADEKVYEVLKGLTPLQKNNLVLLKKIVEKSEQKNPYYLHSTVPMDYFVKNSLFLGLEDDIYD